MINDIIFYSGLGLLTLLAVFIGVIVITDAKEQEKKHKRKLTHKRKHAH